MYIFSVCSLTLSVHHTLSCKYEERDVCQLLLFVFGCVYKEREEERYE